MERGSVTVYLAPALARRPKGDPARTGQRGRPLKHADWVIELALVLQAIYRLPLRQTQGLLASVFQQDGLDVPVPDYSTLCRRRMSVKLPRWRRSGMVIAVDSTGLQIGGPGAWFPAPEITAVLPPRKSTIEQ